MNTMDSSFAQCGSDYSKRGAALESKFNNSSTYTKMRCPFGNRFCFSFVGKFSCGAKVVCLLARRSPSAISFVIPFIVVDAIKRTVRRAYTHISKKVFKGMPRFTHRNTSTTPQVVSRVVSIKTSIFHMRPTSVSAGMSHPVGGVSMRGVYAHGSFGECHE